MTLNLPVFVALSNARSDPEAAADALRIAARYLRSGKPLPPALADHIAAAFERAGRVPAKARAAELARSLRLTSGHRRKVANPIELGSEVDAAMVEGLSESAAVGRVAEQRDCSNDAVADALRIYRRERAKRP